jgi:glutamate-1-semialdehyde 2,1-aminomutase
MSTTTSCKNSPKADVKADHRVGPRSRSAFRRAEQVFPGGTTRVTIERDPVPRYVSHGRGAYLYDADGREFLDLNGNFTTLIHGHAFEPVISALERQLRDGTCFANPTEKEIELATLICARVPRLERIRFCNTGTEAVLFAVKAARAFTGRAAIAKIEGAYHGAYDWAEVSQASTPASWGDPAEPNAVANYSGTPASVLHDVVTLRFNEVEGAERLLRKHAGRLAAILLDPMPSRVGLIPPDPDFISCVQRIAREQNILVISDEVLNFRQSYQGAAARYGLEPDLYALGKIIGGGLPIGAVGGRAEVMAVFEASGQQPALPQGGTFSANPMSMVAGLAAMTALDRAAFAALEQLGQDLRSRLQETIEHWQAPFSITGAASLFRIHPKRGKLREFRDVFCSANEIDAVKDLTRVFADQGIILPTGATGCLSTPMGSAEIDLIVQAFEHFLETSRETYGKLIS